MKEFAYAVGIAFFIMFLIYSSEHIKRMDREYILDLERRGTELDKQLLLVQQQQTLDSIFTYQKRIYNDVRCAE